ncbi:hypothetical protein VCSRO185_3184 [Vibrio cholerae]|nr:hypothetical protein VCSRO185_3184 [Vibrio cholerae]
MRLGLLESVTQLNSHALPVYPGIIVMKKEKFYGERKITLLRCAVLPTLGHISPHASNLYNGVDASLHHDAV